MYMTSQVTRHYKHYAHMTSQVIRYSSQPTVLAAPNSKYCLPQRALHGFVQEDVKQLIDGYLNTPVEDVPGLRASLAVWAPQAEIRRYLAPDDEKFDVGRPIFPAASPRKNSNSNKTR
jgi:hypothetical protein